MKKYILFILLSILLIPQAGHGNSDEAIPAVIFNEIAWMGSITSPNHEWIELHNTTDKTIDLGGWSIKTLDGSLNVQLTKQIVAGDFYLLERGSDDMSSPALADMTYVGALSNEGERLQLFDNNDNLIDEVFSWDTGDNETKHTMAKKSNTEWKNGIIGGTPGQENEFFDPPITNISLEDGINISVGGSVTNIPIWIGIIVLFFVTAVISLLFIPRIKQRAQGVRKDEETEVTIEVSKKEKNKGTKEKEEMKDIEKN